MGEKGLRVSFDKLLDMYNFGNKKKKDEIVYKELASQSVEEMTDESIGIINHYLILNKRKGVLDRNYIQCSSDEDKYYTFLGNITNQDYKTFCRELKNYINNLNNLKDVTKYAYDNVDTVILNTPIERRIYDITCSTIIKGRKKLTVKDTKVLAKYFLSEECLENNLNIEMNEYAFKPKKYLHLDSLKYPIDTLSMIKSELSLANKNLGMNTIDDEILVNYSLLKKRRRKNGNEFGIYDVLSTVFHEACHAKQREEMINPNSYTYDVLLKTKEFIISEVSGSYYGVNYDNILFEIEAEYYGDKKALDTIKRIDKDLYDKVKPLINTKMEFYKSRFKDYRSQVAGREHLESSEAIEKLFLQLFTGDNIKLFLDTYPILNYQYDSKGNYKTPRQLKLIASKLIKNGADPDEVDYLYKNLYWNYFKAKTNINDFYRETNNRINKHNKK